VPRARERPTERGSYRPGPWLVVGETALSVGPALRRAQQPEIECRGQDAQRGSHRVQLCPARQEDPSVGGIEIATWSQERVIRWHDDNEGERDDHADEES